MARREGTRSSGDVVQSFSRTRKGIKWMKAIPNGTSLTMNKELDSYSYLLATLSPFLKPWQNTQSSCCSPYHTSWGSNMPKKHWSAIDLSYGYNRAYERRTSWSIEPFIELLDTILPTDSTRPGESHIQGVEGCFLNITASALEVLLETIHKVMNPFFLLPKTEHRLASVHAWRRKLPPAIVNFPDANNFSESGIQVILTHINSSLNNGLTRRNWSNLLSSKGTYSPTFAQICHILDSSWTAMKCAKLTSIRWF